MSAVDDILNQIPLQQLSQQVGAPPHETEDALRHLVQQLIGTMQMNAQNPEGAQALAGALRDHASTRLLDGDLNLDQVDTVDGEKIATHVFGEPMADAAQRLSLGNVSGSLVQKLLPIIAPIVISYLAKQIQEGKGGDILGQILGGGQPLPSDAGSSSTGGSPFNPTPSITPEPTQAEVAPGGRADGGLRMDDGTDKEDTGNEVTSDRRAQPQPKQQSSGGSLLDVVGNILGRRTK